MLTMSPAGIAAAAHRRGHSYTRTETEISQLNNALSVVILIKERGSDAHHIFPAASVGAGAIRSAVRLRIAVGNERIRVLIIPLVCGSVPVNLSPLGLALAVGWDSATDEQDLPHARP